MNKTDKLKEAISDENTRAQMSNLQTHINRMTEMKGRLMRQASEVGEEIVKARLTLAKLLTGLEIGDEVCKASSSELYVVDDMHIEGTYPALRVTVIGHRLGKKNPPIEDLGEDWELINDAAQD